MKAKKTGGWFQNPFTIFCICAYLMVSQGWVSAQDPARIRSWLPEVPGWDLQDTMEVFHPVNLYERINGAAELFILYRVEEMTSLEYQKGGDYITLQVYRHADPIHAFGMYASERPPGMDRVSAGVQGYHEPTLLNFFSGNLYVKMHTASEALPIQETMRTIAVGFAAAMPPPEGFPPLLEVFPGENKVADSDQYISQSFMGHPFLHSAYTASYRQGEDEYRLFVLDPGSEAAASAMLKEYLAFTGQPEGFSEGRVVLRDPYNGPVPVWQKGRYLLGISNDYQIELDTQKLLERLSEQLEKKGFISLSGAAR